MNSEFFACAKQFSHNNTCGHILTITNPFPPSSWHLTESMETDEYLAKKLFFTWCSTPCLSNVALSADLNSDQPKHYIHWPVKWLSLITLLQRNVLLGNLGLWYTVQQQPLMVTGSLDSSSLPAGQCDPSTAKTAQDWPKKWDIVLKVLTQSPNYPDPDLIKDLWDVPGQIRSMEFLLHNPYVGSIHSQSPDTRHYRTP